ILFMSFRYRVYNSGFIDAKGYRRLVKRVVSYQGDIGTVQGGDHGNVNTIFLQNLLCHISRIGMRYGIMYVQQLYSVQFYGIYQPTGEGQLIRLIMKKGVIRHMYLVKMYPIAQQS